MGVEKALSIMQKLLFSVVGATLSTFLVFLSYRQFDSNRANEKKAAENKKKIAKRLGRSLVKTNPYEDMISCDIINPDDIDVTFDLIGGLESVKQSLHEIVILPLQRPELFSRGKLLGPQKGVLLYGPPGTGKTLLAKAIAKESHAVFINVQTATLMSKWFGDSQKLVTAVFTLAHKLQPSIIFIDEVDSILGQRRSTDHEAVTNMKTEFMALWDGFTTDQNAQVMVLAATNRPWELDEAILRRLPLAFEVGMPDLLQRTSILQVILKGENVEGGIDYKYLASLCEGYSGSDLAEACKQAAYLPIRDLLEQERNGELTCQVPRPLRQSDFEAVLSTSRTSKVAAMEYNNRMHSSGSKIGATTVQVDLSVEELLKIFGAVSAENGPS
eukprot:c22593_g1_i1 orf=504-1661(+)